MKAQPVVLRTAAVWGTTVVHTEWLTPGKSLKLGEDEQAALAKPDGMPISDLPIRAVGAGWELDARGATGGEIMLRGRKENPADLARSGAPIPIVAGDYGLIQYGNFSLFFQFSSSDVKGLVPPWNGYGSPGFASGSFFVQSICAKRAFA